jgi:hypothetical protein
LLDQAARLNAGSRNHDLASLPDEQRFLAWLGVNVQGWTVDAAIDLANAFGATPETAVDLLTGLADKSLKP